MLLACGSFVALAFTGTALAAYNPFLLVAGTNHSPAGGGPVVLGVAQDQNDDATALITFYAPPGYQAKLDQAPNTKIGEVEALVKVGALGGARVEVKGDVKTDDPAKPDYTDPTRNRCSPGLHNAVWILDATLAGNPLRVPLYVDRTAGPETALGSVKIRVCFSSPYVPPPIGAQSGAQLIEAIFDVNVFTNPVARGEHRWTALFTPYVPGTATPNVAGTVQSQAIIRLPVQLTLVGRVIKKGGRFFAELRGSLSEAGRAVAGLRVQILAGKTAGGVKRVKTVRTNSRGTFETLVPLKQKVTFFQAQVTVPIRDVTSQGCQAAAPRCTRVTVGPAVNLRSRSTRLRRR